MHCDNCIDGYIISSVTGRLNPCQVCDSTGELIVCAEFNPGIVVGAFRNNRCIGCGVRENQHKVLTSSLV
jgi:hypothetical protein